MARRARDACTNTNTNTDTNTNTNTSTNANTSTNTNTNTSTSVERAQDAGGDGPEREPQLPQRDDHGLREGAAVAARASPARRAAREGPEARRRDVQLRHPRVQRPRPGAHKY